MLFMCAITACSNSETSKMRKEFVSGCLQNGASRSICSCIFDEVENNYSAEQLKQMNAGSIPAGFPEFAMKSTYKCKNE